jgi:hypothetical protein
LGRREIATHFAELGRREIATHFAKLGHREIATHFAELGRREIATHFAKSGHREIATHFAELGRHTFSFLNALVLPARDPTFRVRRCRPHKTNLKQLSGNPECVVAA